MEQDLELDLESVKKIIGNNKEIIVYGFLSFGYQKLYMDLTDQHFQTNAIGLLGNIKYDIDPASPNPEYKACLTSLVLENLKRAEKQQPLIYLLFVIQHQSNRVETDLDLKRVAASHRDSVPARSVTDSELRRCYKMYAEGTPEIRNIIDQSFKFVKYSVDHFARTYQLHEVQPFWKRPEWLTLWQRRHPQSFSARAKQYPWRDALFGPKPATLEKTREQLSDDLENNALSITKTKSYT